MVSKRGGPTQQRAPDACPSGCLPASVVVKGACACVTLQAHTALALIRLLTAGLGPNPGPFPLIRPPPCLPPVNHIHLPTLFTLPHSLQAVTM